MTFFKVFFLSVFIPCSLPDCAVNAAAAWLADLPKAQAQAKAQGKFVLIHFSGSDWCGWCLKLHKEVFLKPEFEAYAKSNLVLVEIDFPKRKPQAPVLQKANQQLAEQFRVEGYPTLILLDSQGTRLGSVSYGQGGTKLFLAELEKLIHPSPEMSPPKTPPKKGVDPRHAGKEVKVAEANVTDLTLWKITGPKQRRQVLINNQTLSAGETATVKVSAGRVKVRCVEIRERSVIVTVEGQKERRELRLAEGT